MTAQDFITNAQPCNPGRQFAYDALSQSLIAVKTTEGDWYPVASQSISGEWVSLPYEILGNGRRMIDMKEGNYWIQWSRA